MRTGTLAGIVGITTRAVRHYHRMGLLPERPRHSNGYEQAERTGWLPAETSVSPELAAHVKDIARASARFPGPEPAMAAKERELPALLETGPCAGLCRDRWNGPGARARTDRPVLRRRPRVRGRHEGAGAGLVPSTFALPGTWSTAGGTSHAETVIS